MPAAYSPLRYPGGKSVLSDFLAEIIRENSLEGGVYVEPFAGGAGAALSLLFGEHVEKIVINDADYCIFQMWKSILDRTDKFLKLIADTPITVEEWRRQKEIYYNPKKYSELKVGFATFFLNRCNRSGILMKSGVIGGVNQTGKWKIDARFNKIELSSRVERIALYRDRIEIFNEDAVDLLQNHVSLSDRSAETLVYLDPPYYVKGSQLYLNHYVHSDHEILERALSSQDSFIWLMTYDNVPEINDLYDSYRRIPFTLNYSAHSAKQGSELLILPRETKVPSDYGSLRT